VNDRVLTVLPGGVNCGTESLNTRMAYAPVCRLNKHTHTSIHTDAHARTYMHVHTRACTYMCVITMHVRMTHSTH